MVSYVVITYNRAAAVARCLTELRAQRYAGAREIIVVDNGSTDGTVAAVAAAGVQVIEAGRNLGVPGARNLGFRRARGDYVVFMDDDAEFSDASATTRAVAILERDPLLAVLNFAVVTPSTGALERAAIPRADKRARPGTVETAYFCGCAFALRRRLVPADGPFWDELFYACEELDCSYALIARGLRIFSTADVTALHWKDPGARPPAQFIYFNARNRPLVALKWLPPLAVLTTAVSWWGYLAVLAARRGQLRFLWRGIRDALGLAPSVLARRTPLAGVDRRKVRALAGRLWC